MVKIIIIGGQGVIYACNVTHVPRVGESLVIKRDEKYLL